MSVSLNELHDIIKQKGAHLQIWGVNSGGKSILECKFVFKNETFINNLIAEAKAHKASDAFFHFVDNKGYVTLNGVKMANSEFEKLKI